MRSDLRNENREQQQNTHSAPVRRAGSDHWTLLVVFLSLLLDLLGFTVILPLMPSLLEYYDHHDQV